MSFPSPSLENVVAALMEGLDGAPIPGQESSANPRGLLTANDRINSESPVSDAVLPFLRFATGGLTAAPWQMWQQQIKATIPAVLKVRVRPDEGGARMRQAIDVIFRRMALLLGLPVDEAGKVMPYTEDTARRYDAGELADLVDRTGPHFSVARVTEAPGTPYATADLAFTVEFLLDMDPRKFYQAQVVAIGVNLPGAAGENVETEWTPDAPTPDEDTTATGRFNSPDPEILVGAAEVPRAFPPFPQGDDVEDAVEGPPIADAVASVAVYPRTAAVGIAGTYQLVAVVQFGDGNVRNVTAASTWATSDATKATVSASGLVTGVGVGTASITATYLGIASSAAVVTVS